MSGTVQMSFADALTVVMRLIAIDPSGAIDQLAKIIAQLPPELGGKEKENPPS